MKKFKNTENNHKLKIPLDMRSFNNLIRGWKLNNILHYTPRYILDRINLFFYESKYPDQPWLTQQANSILSTLLKPTDFGLEWGSGRSTLWFAKRIKHLTSVEHDEAWYNEVFKKLKESNISNVNYHLYKVTEGCIKPKDSPYVQVVNTFNKDSLDLVLVDGVYRGICANKALEKIRPGGIIILDNANWYLPCDSISPNSRPKDSTLDSKEWAQFLNNVKSWHLIWTSNGVTDTAIWFKPPKDINEKI